MLFPANLLPLMSVTILGMTRESQIFSGVTSLWNEQWVIVAVLVAAFVVVLPFVRFGLLTTVLACVQLGRCPAWLGRAFRWSLRLDQWAMPDVFLIGFAIGYSRVAANLTVTVEPGGLCLIAAAFLCMLSRATLDRRTVWRAVSPEHAAPAPSTAAVSCEVCELVLPFSEADAPCPRCKLPLMPRKPDAMVRTTALLVASFVLYFPANLYPMSIGTQLGSQVPHRIIDGIRDLYQAGFLPLAIIIFCTSILIPMVKIVGLGGLLWSIHHRSTRHLVLKTRFYRFIDEIGRWSNVDVFTIAVFAPLMQFGALAGARAAPGATAFILVVTFTMAASQTFDPRLLWDAGQGERS